MAINIHHVYSANVEISFFGRANYAVKERTCGSMDKIAEYICEVLVKRDFTCANVIDATTSELLMVITRI